MRTVMVVVTDMSTKPRLMDGQGNAMLVAGIIFEACKFHELLFEQVVKKKIIDKTGQMKLPIVLDKLPTGFDAPSATYLSFDKQVRDHGLFQAVCRVNRQEGDDKEYGYIIDYKYLFKSLEGAVKDYTSGELDGFHKEDVAGLLENRLEKASEALEDALERVRALCEPDLLAMVVQGRADNR